MEYDSNEKVVKKVKLIKKILLIVMIVFICLFSFTIYEYYRVKTDKTPLVCLNSKNISENDKEDDKVCYGLFYKYKEYYLKNTKIVDAREFTMFFTSFDRDLERNK